MARYRYDGKVTSFGKLISERWVGETIAVSEEKAKSNLIFRFKKEKNLVTSSKIELPDKLYKLY